MKRLYLLQNKKHCGQSKGCLAVLKCFEDIERTLFFVYFTVAEVSARLRSFVLAVATFLIEIMNGSVRKNGIAATANGRKRFGSSKVQVKLPIIGPIIAPAPKDAELKP